MRKMFSKETGLMIALMLVTFTCLNAYAEPTFCESHPDGTDCTNMGDGDGYYGSNFCCSDNVCREYRNYYCSDDLCKYDSEYDRVVDYCDDGHSYTIDSCASGHCVNTEVTDPYGFTPSLTQLCYGAYFGVTAQKAHWWIPDTTVDYYLDSTNILAGCPSTGDGNWGGAACGMTTSLGAGTYSLIARYSVWGRNYQKTITSNFRIVTNCDVCSTHCAHGWGGQGGAGYTMSFTGGYTISNGVYISCPNCDMKVSDISYYNVLCSDGWPSAAQAKLTAWTYNDSNGVKLGVAENDWIVSHDKEKRDFYGDPAHSTTCGGAVQGSYGLNSMSIYNFTEPANYSIYLAQQYSYCDSPALYVCPWLASGSGLCYTGIYWSGMEGWVPLNTYNVFIPSVNITISKPADVFDPKERTLLRSWNITKNGEGRAQVRIEKLCNGWPCSFVGYTENSTIIMNQSDKYVVFMNITTLPNDIRPHPTGISVSFDDDYGLSCIESRSVQSMMNITIPHTV